MRFAADGSGTVILEIGVDDEAAEFFLQGEDPFEDNEFTDDPDAEFREERRGDFEWVIEPHTRCAGHRRPGGRFGRCRR